MRFVFLFLFAFLSFFQVKGFGDYYSEKSEELLDCDGEVYYNGGITGCGCFLHCNCFSHYHEWFPEDTSWHPHRSADMLWHVFMKNFLSAYRYRPKTPAEYRNLFGGAREEIYHWVRGYNPCGFICLPSEYLNLIEKLAESVERHRVEHIKMLRKDYTDPRKTQELYKRIRMANEKAKRALDILSSLPDLIIPLYKKVIAECSHKSLASLYSGGLIGILEGDFERGLKDITSFIHLAKNSKQEHLLSSQVFQKQGESFLEVGIYHEAILSLTEAIQKDPENLEAYFQRALAYFETGDFDRALGDYSYSKKMNTETLISAPNKFIDAFTISLLASASDTLINFIPSLCTSGYGFGLSLCAFAEHPTESLNAFADAAYEVTEQIVEYLKTVDQEKLNECATEIVDLYINFNQLSNQEKGALIGTFIGKCGVDFTLMNASIKEVTALRKLRRANQVCTLESMALSPASKETITVTATKCAAEREKLFQNLKIHYGHQNKHIPGMHNYEPDLKRSIFEHSDPEGLLKKFAGKGRPVRSEIASPGYKEVVDFKEHIGIFIDKNKGLELPTTKGTIHYSKNGAHIVPTHPDSITISQ